MGDELFLGGGPEGHEPVRVPEWPEGWKSADLEAPVQDREVSTFSIKDIYNESKHIRC